MSRMPHRDDPRDPWSNDEVSPLYAPTIDEPHVPEVDVTDNPVVHELLDADGNVIRQWTERPPFGFQVPS